MILKNAVENQYHVWELKGLTREDTQHIYEIIHDIRFVGASYFEVQSTQGEEQYRDILIIADNKKHFKEINALEEIYRGLLSHELSLDVGSLSQVVDEMQLRHITEQYAARILSSPTVDVHLVSKQDDLVSDQKSIVVEDLTTKKGKLLQLVYDRYKDTWFSSLDVMTTYEEVYEPITISTVSTTLSRFYMDDLLIRRGNRNNRAYLINFELVQDTEK